MNFKARIRIFETYSNYSELDSLKTYEDIFDEIIGKIKIYDFLIFCNEVCQDFGKI